ncbi:DUF429 domain-containing protein [Actinokineospora iranica]|uniref:Predicted nuclease (RNAse H fold) n=1 Tax=Actinokineospora iranica TaxID=1271860 RepID=A0A1G6VER8_9PSEU|nr:DUF429 domain-containing protein [Actinokineospora iranica]SDD52048.1 Predicted nuclease (RNAse H fold) [Actinokineospora iranica]
MTGPVAGVDGVPGGWVIAVVRPDGSVDWRIAENAESVLAQTRDCVAVGVDIPMGLSDRHIRDCDRVARLRLGNARSSVFFAPVRAVLDGTSHAHANAISRAVTGSGISVQLWSILHKIRDWDAHDEGDRVVEVHPEVSFRALAPDVAFVSKKTALGLGQRIAALLPFVDAARALTTAPARAGADDALDALVAAWSARRWSARQAEIIGGEPDPVTKRPMRVIV